MKKWLGIGLLLGMVVVLAFAATADRFGGSSRSWDKYCTFNADPIASQTGLSVACTFDMPQNGTLVGAQAVCLTETGGAKTIDILEAAVIGATVELDAADDPVFFTAGAGTFEFADEAEVTITYTTAAGESATDCSATLSFYLH